MWMSRRQQWMTTMLFHLIMCVLTYRGWTDCDCRKLNYDDDDDDEIDAEQKIAFWWWNDFRRRTISLLDHVDYVWQSSLTCVIKQIEYFKIDILLRKMILCRRLFLLLVLLTLTRRCMRCMMTRGKISAICILATDDSSDQVMLCNVISGEERVSPQTSQI